MWTVKNTSFHMEELDRVTALAGDGRIHVQLWSDDVVGSENASFIMGYPQAKGLLKELGRILGVKIKEEQCQCK